MKAILTIFNIFLILTGIFILSCEEEEIQEAQNKTNKLRFTEIKIDTVSYREATISYELENLKINDVRSLDICYNTTGKPTKDDNTISLTITSSGSKTIRGLSPDTEYYFRLYTVFDEATKYWEENTFTTLKITKPELQTTKITDTTAKSAKSGGTIIDKNGGTISSCGVCINTDGSPTTDDIITIHSLENTSFNSNIDSLHYSTTYYVRAYATNEAGTGYGNEISFTTIDGLAELTTKAVSNVTSVEAKSGGNISENWGYEITARGVCWSKTSNPTIEDNKTENGNGTGSFESEITGLDKNSVYYVRAYATNEPGTAYGNERQFTTSELNVSVTTDNIFNVTAISAEGGGRIINSSNYSITQRGLCWNTSGNPTTIDNSTQDGTGEGDFTSNITGLNYETTYYVRAYATNDAGTVYGDEKTMTTLDGIPLLSTTSVTNITPSSAESGGEITNNEGLNINSRGVCWNTTGNPITSDNSTINGTGTGTFRSSLTNLNLNTTYYVRAYAATDAGTGYGDEVIFSIGGKPFVSTSTIWGIDGASAESGGNVTDDGGFSVTEKGICWSTSENPTTSDNSTTEGSGTGSFTSSITGLSSSTTYYVRAYATNDAGTSYGEERTFTTTDGLAEISTSTIDSIDGSSAISGGNITDNDGYSVTSRGVCWSTSSNPTTSDNHTTKGSGTGSFTSSITGLSPSTTYYVRAYATNDAGTSYGEEKTFTTTDGLAELTTNEVTNIDSTSATSGGNITDNGGFPITARGVCWSSSQNPTINDNSTSDGSGTGSFTSEITGLTGGTTYYVRAFATNEAGTAYGEATNFYVLNENDVMNPVTGKIWMDRNLGASHVATSSTDEDAYGNLYQWGRAADGHEKRNSGTTSMLSNSDTPGHGDFITVSSLPYDWRSPKNDNLWQGINGTNNPCPDGYRLPTSVEWYYERQSWSSDDAAGAFASPLKLPVAGRRDHQSGSIGFEGYYGIYWSSYVDSEYWAFGMRIDPDEAYDVANRRADGCSVRCIKD